MCSTWIPAQSIIDIPFVHHLLDDSVRMRETVHNLTNPMMWNLDLMSNKSLLWFRHLSRKTILLIYMPGFWDRDCSLISTSANSSKVIHFPQRLLISSNDCSKLRRCPHIRVIQTLWNLWKHLHFCHLPQPTCFITRFENQKKRKSCLACRSRDWYGLLQTQDPVCMHNSEESILNPLFWLNQAGLKSLLPTSQASVLIIHEHMDT